MFHHIIIYAASFYNISERWILNSDAEIFMCYSVQAFFKGANGDRPLWLLDQSQQSTSKRNKFYLPDLKHLVFMMWFSAFYWTNDRQKLTCQEEKYLTKCGYNNTTTLTSISKGQCTWITKRKIPPHPSGLAKQINTCENIPCHFGWTSPLMHNCVQWLVLILLKGVNTNHAAEIPFTSSIAVMDDLPSLLEATHTYFPLSLFSAMMICKDPFWEKRSPSMGPGVSYLDLEEKVFTPFFRVCVLLIRQHMCTS